MRGFPVAVVALAMASAAMAAEPPLGHPPKPADWAALARLPDWSGAWVPDVPDQNRKQTTDFPPWTPAAAAEIAEQRAAEAAGHPPGPYLDCLPEGMPSWMLISHNPFEVLFTPGRVTMLGESDSNRLRRVYTDGRAHPADPDATFHGDSIGHWEGQTLVVDTIAILPQAWLSISEAIGIPNDGDMHVVERIHLTGPDEMHDDLEITAPHVLAATWKTTRIYNRSRGAGSDFEEGVCHQGDFVEGKDRYGNAIFVPQHLDNGNVLPTAR